MTASNETRGRRTLPSRLMLSAVTIGAAAGLMGTATFGAFDNQHDTVTRAVVAGIAP